MFRIIASEWITTTTYFTRDLNSIEWSLEGRKGNELSDPNDVETRLERQFMIRRRISRQKMLVQDQINLCSSNSRPSWTASQLASNPTSTAIVEKTAADLQADFNQALTMIDQNIDRVEHSILLLSSLMSILHGKLSINEIERGVAQNKYLMVLTFIATFFLPINAVSAILNMTGTFGPMQPNFGTFWTIALPISLFLVGVLVVLYFWKGISKYWSRGLPNKTGHRDGGFV
jgi:Mg2+ and Co2+ transporter CorA